MENVTNTNKNTAIQTWRQTEAITKVVSHKQLMLTETQIPKLSEGELHPSLFP
jgi:hypothetical protein